MTTFLRVFDTYDFAVRQGLILTLVATSVYILLRAGLFAVPQVGFMAVGSYVSALLSLKQGWSFPVVLLCGAAAASAVGLVVGALLSRLSGIYLAVATIGFSEVVREGIINIDLTGGPQGLFGIPRAANDLYLVGCLLGAVVLLGRLSVTRFGLAMAGIREEPLMTAHQGVSVRMYRLALFGVSGFLAGTGGVLFVHQSGFVEPNTYSFELLVQVLATVVLGGMASTLGPVLGSLIVDGLPQILSGFNEYRSLVNGVLIVLVVAVVPTGVAGRVYSLLHLLRRLVGARVLGPAGDLESKAVVEVSSHPAAIGAPFGSPRAEVLLKIDSVAKSFGGIRALQGVSLDVRSHEVFGVIGPNGSGKTSLLNVLSGVYSPDAGSASIDGQSFADSWGRPDKIARRGIARTFQGIRLLSDLTVFDNVLLGAYRAQSATALESVLGLPRARSQDRRARAGVVQIMEELQLTPFAGITVFSLPYGIQRKVEIARAVVGEPRLLLLDEPTAGMTPRERDEIFDLVQALRARGITVIVVEHDVSVMSRHCDRVAVLNFGKTISIGDPDTVLKNEEVIDAYIGRPAAAG